ncbi:MAG: ABC transporter ATP-binding protein/permease [Lachnospiraceae bacterium]|nr:ABC transporter ATP-binding protein/permease [Lachnospiraceae bacterium]
MFDKRLMAMCPESKKYIVGNILCQWLELIMNAVMIFVVAVAVEKLYRKELTSQEIITGIVVLFLALVMRFFMTKKTTQMSYLASKTVKRVMREEIYKKILRLGNSYREHATTAELVQESVEGVEQLESYFGQYVPQFFYAFIAPFTLFVLFGIAGSFKVAAVLLICVPLIPGTIMMVQKIAKKLLSKYWDQYAKLGSTFLENLQGMTTLKTYKADGYKNEQMNEESENFRKITMKVLTMQLNSIIIMDFFAYGGAALGIAMACKGFINGDITLTSTIFMILLSADFFLPMRKLGSYFHVAMNGMAASDRIFKFLGEKEPEVKNAKLPESGLEIKLDGINFSYDGKKEVLTDVSMVIPEGKFVGIVGESGSGKSTIASLIMGRNTISQDKFSDEKDNISQDENSDEKDTISSGEISVAGVNISEINEENILQNINYVGLESTFFKGSVRENLMLALGQECCAVEDNFVTSAENSRGNLTNVEENSSEAAVDDKLWAALEECNIAGFFREQDGLDTPLAENASNLSGGQRQRLAMARALLHDPKIYIFDEATSNIDVESEELILATIKKLAETKTVIMITHRLMNVVDADEIYCLENGRVMGHGTHENLLNDCATYGTLWNTQKELENFGKEGAAV